MDVRKLGYFLAVVDHGGFNRAATALYVAQPSLSQAIRALERDLGTELFHRVGKRVVLTEAGRALIEPARQVVRGLDLARASVGAVSGLAAGRVEIAVTPSQAVEPLTAMIDNFTRRHPAVSVTVRAAFSAGAVIEMVRTGVTELGLLASITEPAATCVDIHPHGRQRFVLATAPDGPFPPGQPVRREALAGRRLIAGQTGTGMRDYVEGLRTDGIDVTIAVESEHREAILPLVLAGAGVAVLADAWSGLAERAGALVLDLEPAAYLHIALVSRRDGLSPAAREFLTVNR